jgi:hypothetical protein
MPSHDEPDPPSTEPPEQTNDVPNQRGTSSGEIGQNPVEIIGKPIHKPAGDPKVKEEDSGSKG